MTGWGSAGWESEAESAPLPPRHLDVELPRGELTGEARQLRQRLDLAAAADEQTRSYVERLEAMVDEARLPAGDELISEIERFLRQRGNEGSQPN